MPQAKVPFDMKMSCFQLIVKQRDYFHLKFFSLLCAQDCISGDWDDLLRDEEVIH